MLWEVAYHGFYDYFRAGTAEDAERKARILSCNSSFTLRIIGA